MKGTILTVIGVFGSALASLFGGWDASIITLMIFMAVDYITGLIVAGVFHTSTKSTTGALESRAGWKGLLRKGGTLTIVLVASLLDILIGTSFVRDAVVIAYTVNEAISIVENVGLMGIPIPDIIIRAIDVLKKQTEKGGGSDSNTD